MGGKPQSGKLKKDWQLKKACINLRVANVMMPIQRADGTYGAGVKDTKMGNTDQVSVYFEDHSTSMWRFRESEDFRTCGTGGKDKDCFTAQLTVFLNYRKVRQVLRAITTPLC